MERPIENWIKCDPEAMSQMSQAAIMYALRDAKSDILSLAEQNKALVEALTYARKWLEGQDGNAMLMEMGNPDVRAAFAKIDEAMAGSKA